MKELPIPTTVEIQDFAAIYKEQFGVELSQEEAQKLATSTVQLFYIKHYAIHPLCPKE